MFSTEVPTSAIDGPYQPFGWPAPIRLSPALLKSLATSKTPKVLCSPSLSPPALQVKELLWLCYCLWNSNSSSTPTLV